MAHTAWGRWAPIYLFTYYLFRWAPIYFGTFIVVVVWVMLNVFNSIVILNFMIAFEEFKSTASFSVNDFDRFVDIWAEYDPLGSGYIEDIAIATLTHAPARAFMCHVCMHTCMRACTDGT